MTIDERLAEARRRRARLLATVRELTAGAETEVGGAPYRDPGAALLQERLDQELELARLEEEARWLERRASLLRRRRQDGDGRRFGPSRASRALARAVALVLLALGAGLAALGVVAAIRPARAQASSPVIAPPEALRRGGTFVTARSPASCLQAAAWVLDTAAPINGHALAVTFDGNAALYAWQRLPGTQDGQPVWRYAVYAQPAADGTRVMLVGNNGSCYPHHSCSHAPHLMCATLDDPTAFQYEYDVLAAWIRAACAPPDQDH